MFKADKEIVAVLADKTELRLYKEACECDALAIYGELGDWSYTEVYCYWTGHQDTWNYATCLKYATAVDAELVQRGVLKPDNRRHKVVGKMDDVYRISRAWHNRKLKEPANNERR